MVISSVIEDPTKAVRITAVAEVVTTRIVVVITRIGEATIRIVAVTIRTEAVTTGIPDLAIVVRMEIVLRKEVTIGPVGTQDLSQELDTLAVEVIVRVEIGIQTATPIPDLHGINHTEMFLQRHGINLMPFFFGNHGKRHPDF